MDFKDLSYVIAIANTEYYKAADMLYVTHDFTKFLSNLERKWGRNY